VFTTILSGTFKRGQAKRWRIPPWRPISTDADNGLARAGLRLHAAGGMVQPGCQGLTLERWLESRPKAVPERALPQQWPQLAAFFSIHKRFQPRFDRPPDDPMMKIAVKTGLRAMLAARPVGTHDKRLAENNGVVACYPPVSISLHNNPRRWQATTPQSSSGRSEHRGDGSQADRPRNQT